MRLARQLVRGFQKLRGVPTGPEPSVVEETEAPDPDRLRNPLAKRHQAEAERRTAGSMKGPALTHRSPQMLGVRRDVPKALKTAKAKGLLTRTPEGVRLAPDFVARARAAAEYKARVRDAGEMWKVGYGDYELDMYRGPVEVREDPFQLVGFERRLAGQLETMLETGAEPVVAVDFGGMFGLTFLRLANRFAAEIDAGKLALAVTNLGFDLDEALGQVGHGMNELRQEEAEVIAAQRDRVHYLHADAEELLDAEITLPDGRTHALEGGVDLLHESYAICHGQKNDVDLPLLGQSLSERGVFFLGSTSTHAGRGDEAIRAQAHDLGRKNLGAEVIELNVASSSYAVYARDPDLAQVHVDPRR